MEQDVHKLLKKYKAGTATKQETALVNQWYAAETNRQSIPEAPTAPLLEEQLIWNRIKAAIPIKTELPVQAKSKKLIDTKWLAAAASLLLLLSIGFYLYKNTYNHEAAMAKLRAHDIKAGGNKALLILADGSQITLNEQGDGEIAKQSGTTITKTTNGQLIYTFNDQKSERSTFNTIRTPKGGQFQVSLPDGTKVWLNAQSSLTFPTSFTEKERFVRLKGEGYFEVAKLKNKPFIVLTDDQSVQVLGTHFNINSYEDENREKTTLLEGSVRVTNVNRQTVTLLPNQEAEFSNGSLKVKQVDVEEAIAWKNGKFKFHNENIESLMRKVARWYDVDIEYKGKISKEGFGGQVSRSRNVSEILEVLQLTQLVHFEIEGRRIIVSSD